VLVVNLPCSLFTCHVRRSPLRSSLLGSSPPSSSQSATFVAVGFVGFVPAIAAVVMAFVAVIPLLWPVSIPGQWYNGRGDLPAFSFILSSLSGLPQPFPLLVMGFWSCLRRFWGIRDAGGLADVGDLAVAMHWVRGWVRCHLFVRPHLLVTWQLSPVRWGTQQVQ